jgi:hypothetical protein
MAKLKSAANPVTPDAGTGPATKVIADRLDEQHRRIFQTVSIVETVMKVINDLDDCGEDSELSALWGSLSLVRETLENIAEHIEPNMLMAHG